MFCQSVSQLCTLSFLLIIFKSLPYFVIIANVADSARILAITPMPYFSHQYFYRPVWRELAARGHEVVLITAVPMPDNNTNIRQIDISVVTKMLPSPSFSESYIDMMEGYYELMLAMSEVQLSNPEVQELMHNSKENFDLVIVEFTCPVMFAFKKRFKTPLILVSPLDIFNNNYELTGSPSHELLYSMFREIQLDPSFYHRVKTFLSWIYDYWRIPISSYFERVNIISKKFFGRYAVTIEDAFKQVDLVLANVNIALQEVRPLSPAIIPLGGGMFLKAAKHEILTKDFQNFLDRSIEGIIYISFGTYVQTRSMSGNTIEKLMETFSTLPYKVLWKSDTLPADMLRTVNKTGNVFIRKWVPQTKILAHKNVKLFITQGGIQSLEEAIILKKPTITLPFVADQHPNANRMEQLHLGARLDINTVTPSKLKQTIEKVLSDQQMLRNLEKYSNLLQDQPLKPKERAVWWIEYILRNKSGRHLHARTLPWWQHMYLDVISFLVAILIAAIFIIIKLIPFKDIYTFWRSNKLNKLKTN